MKYLFHLHHAYSVPIVQPLVAYLRTQRPGDEFRLFCSSDLTRLLPPDWPASMVLRTLRDVKAFAPDMALTAENYIDDRIPGLKVQMFHGVGVEKMSHYKIRHFFDIYLTSGPCVTVPFQKKATELGYFQVIETGWPKFDHILNYPRTGGLFPDLRAEPGQKVILYAPTFSRRMQSAEVLADRIPSQMKPGEIWLVKFHPLMSEELRASFERAENDHLRIVRDNDITPYLHLADLMISDTSSVVYEFSCLGKPVITFRTRGNPDKGLNIQEVDELRPALDLLLRHPSTGEEERRNALLRVNPYLDGNIAERVFTILEQVHREGFAPSKPKPANFFRKMKVFFRNY